MNDRQDRLREMLQRRGDRVHSNLTMSDIRDAGMRRHRHPMRLLGPALVAAAVVILVVVVALAGRIGSPSTPPAGPGPGVSQTIAPTATVHGSSRPSAPLPTGAASNLPPITTASARTAVPAGR